MICENVKVKSGSYPVYIGENLLDDIGKLLRNFSGTGERLLLVSDNNVYNLYGDFCLSSLESAGFQVARVEIPPGEESKNMEMLRLIYDKAVDSKMDRQSPIVALGGGVVGDLAGFAAATYMRGVPFIQIPTTLLAQVDSSVGGKTAINHPRGKNLIGAFYQPRCVIADIKTLFTLPESEYRAGLAEVIKYGVIGDGEFLSWLVKNLEALMNKETDCLSYAVSTAVKNKAAVVESDEKELGRRKILNMGHTFAHALEAATGYRYYLHGEAVLIGMEMAVKLALEMKMLSEKKAGIMINLFTKVGYKVPPEDLETESVMQKLIHDKKREGKDMVYILPRDEGEAEIVKNPPEQMIKGLIRNYLGN